LQLINCNRWLFLFSKLYPLIIPPFIHRYFTHTLDIYNLLRLELSNTKYSKSIHELLTLNPSCIRILHGYFYNSLVILFVVVSNSDGALCYIVFLFPWNQHLLSRASVKFYINHFHFRKDHPWKTKNSTSGV